MASDSGVTSIDAPLQPPSITAEVDSRDGTHVRVRNAECDSLNVSDAGSWQMDQVESVSHHATPGNGSPNTETRKFGVYSSYEAPAFA